MGIEEMRLATDVGADEEKGRLGSSSSINGPHPRRARGGNGGGWVSIRTHILITHEHVHAACSWYA